MLEIPNGLRTQSMEHGNSVDNCSNWMGKRFVKKKYQQKLKLKRNMEKEKEQKKTTKHWPLSTE